jgi:hypothetical protein
MRLLAIVSGEYGRRHVNHIQANGPLEWAISTWPAPHRLPLMIDEPAEFVPATLPPADLILSLGEQPGIAELVPEVARITGAQAVIAPVDNEAWLPRGLARQLRGWLQAMGVACVTPKPFCSLSENGYYLGRRQWVEYTDPLIAAFAAHFGRPRLRLTIDPANRLITAAAVLCDSACGCARFVAEGLIGVSVDEAEEKAGLLHHHYPCQGSYYGRQYNSAKNGRLGLLCAAPRAGTPAGLRRVTGSPARKAIAGTF